MTRALLLLFLLPATALAQWVPMGGGSGGVCSLSPTADVIAKTYTATATSGTAFQCTGDPGTCLRVGTHPRATIGPCEPGSPDICFGPNDFGYSSKARIWGDFTAQTFVARTFLDVQGSAYLINNDGPLRLTDTDGLLINNTTPLKAHWALPVTFDSAEIGADTCIPQAVTVTGAVVNDFVTVNANFRLVAGVTVDNAFVTGPDTVELNLCNITGGALDPASGPYLFTLER